MSARPTTQPHHEARPEAAIITRRSFATGLLGIGAAVFLPGRALAQAPLATIVRSQGIVELKRWGSILPIAQGTTIESGDAISSGPESKLRVEFSDGAFLVLGEDSHVVVSVTRDNGRRRTWDIVVGQGTARLILDRSEGGGAMTLRGGHAHTRAVSFPADWILCPGRQGSDVVTLAGRVLVCHEYQYWRMTLGPRVGMSRIPAKDVLKNRFPKATLFSSTRLAALPAATDI